MTVVAAAANPKKKRPRPFVGIGRECSSLALVWFLWLIRIFLIGVGAIMTESVTYVVQNTVEVCRKGYVGAAEFHLLPLIAAVAYLLWGGLLVLCDRCPRLGKDAGPTQGARSRDVVTSR